MLQKKKSKCADEIEDLDKPFSPEYLSNFKLAKWQAREILEHKNASTFLSQLHNYLSSSIWRVQIAKSTADNVCSVL